MLLIDRKKDMLLQYEDLEPLYTFRDFPVYMGVTEQEESQDEFADMEWAIAKGSGMIQLKNLFQRIYCINILIILVGEKYG